MDEGQVPKQEAEAQSPAKEAGARFLRKPHHLAPTASVRAPPRSGKLQAEGGRSPQRARASGCHHPWEVPGHRGTCGEKNSFLADEARPGLSKEAGTARPGGRAGGPGLCALARLFHRQPMSLARQTDLRSSVYPP